MSEEKFPYIPQELIEELNKRFPNRFPNESWTDRKIWIEKGKRELIEFLLFKQQEQMER